jgi:hypothetical protein
MRAVTYARPLGTAVQKWQMEPRATTKDKVKKATVKRRKDAYLAAEKRDGMRCRCCGKPVVRTLELRLDKLEHHHVQGRDCENPESTENISCICRECHDERHVTRVLKISGNADKRLRMEKAGRVWFTRPVVAQAIAKQGSEKGWKV